ncbi:MAG: ABC transporter substrate-binding protein [Spirochaetaceae bacterium]|jgi:hypothetical protein|nr:ABC transporter substrate-binding protein [Spirochaetaceae bacterium]
MKKTALLFLTISLAFSGCNSGQNNAGPVVKISMLLLGDRPTNGRLEKILAEKINPRIRELAGAELSLRYIPWSDWQNQYQLAMASGDSSLDLVITATDWLFAWEITRKGGFLGLTDEMLQTHAPVTWKAVSPAHWDVCRVDGKIYFIPEDQYTQYTNHGAFWRGDWAREAGLSQIRNFTELEAYLDGVKQHHPEAVPYDVSGPNADKGSGILDGFFAEKNPTQAILGIAVGNYGIFRYNLLDPYHVVSEYYEGPEFIAAAETFDRWAKKGFWREDVLNYTGDTRQNQELGLSGLDEHHTQTYFGHRVTMDRLIPGSDLQYFYWGMSNKNVVKDLITHGAMAINAASKNPEKALQVFDLLRNDKQIYQWYNYGVEGEDYILTADGKRDWPPNYDPDADNALGGNFWGGRNDALEIPDAKAWTGIPDFLATLNSFAKDYPLEKFAFDNTSVSAEMSALGDVCAAYIPQITYGKTKDPQKAIADFRAALKNAGYEKVRDEINRQIRGAYAQ